MDRAHIVTLAIKFYSISIEEYGFMDASVADLIEEFFSQYHVRKYSKGQILIFNGDGGDVVYNLVSGRVKQYDVTYRGDEVILNVYKPPAFFPMSLAINHGENIYIYEAETDIETRQAPADMVVAFLKANPTVMFDLLGRLYRGIDGMLGRMAYLMGGSAKGRLMYELLIACRRFGEKNLDNGYALMMHEADLGARAGLSRETVSREMKKLINEDLVTLSKGEIVIKDVAAFEARLGQVF